MNEPLKGDPLLMSDDDRFHKFVVCATPIRCESVPPSEVSLLFVVFRRGTGKYDIVHVMRTFVDGRQASNAVSSRRGIAKGNVEKALGFYVSLISEEFEEAVGVKLKWRTLDLSDTDDKQEQSTRLVAWISQQGTPVCLN